MNINTLLVDDEVHALDSLEILLSGFPEINIVAKLTDPLEALRQLCTESVDLLFIDIQMPGVDGLDIVRQLRECNPYVIVIFITAHRDYAEKAIKLNVFNYLLKPVSRVELDDSISRVITLLDKGASPQTILINNRNEMLVVKVCEIACLEASGSYTYLFLQDGSKKMATQNLGKVCESIDMQDFLKVNRSTYVRKDLIISIRKKDKECTYQFASEMRTVSVSSVFLRKVNEYF